MIQRKKYSVVPTIIATLAFAACVGAPKKVMEEPARSERDILMERIENQFKTIDNKFDSELFIHDKKNKELVVLLRSLLQMYQNLVIAEYNEENLKKMKINKDNKNSSLVWLPMGIGNPAGF